MILYIPANLYPIMTVMSLGRGKPDTIISGIIALHDSGLWYLALIVFLASIFVPLVKIIGLAVLLLSVQFQAVQKPLMCTKLYHFIEKVGRWSMLDVFMVSLMIAVVSLGNAAKVYAGVGLRAFGMVVVFTMFATLSFDCRLLWDKKVMGQKSDVE
jgi:paraquat-inducible protein A